MKQNRSETTHLRWFGLDRMLPFLSAYRKPMLLCFALMLGGGLIGCAGEALRLRISPVLAGVCFSVALGMHLVETAYPLADVLTKVPFFGGSPTLAIAFSVVFALAAILNVVSAFMEHNA